ncbi:MAG: MBL fold metallo-hydrolase [SAR324 cluster bacterium]|nr:MBL fold metallo-hydrolase [SAR324 cluster bacterium]
MSKVRDAVVAVLRVNDQICAIVRQSHLLSFPGYHSFPGGKVDRTDADTLPEAPGLEGLEPQQFNALCRELQEELCFDLIAGLRDGTILRVQPLALALAPPFDFVRFRSQFYRIDLACKPELTPDSGEIAELMWNTPNELLEHFRTGDALMVPPTRWLLEGLADNMDCGDLGDLSPKFDYDHEVPCMEVLHGLRTLHVPSQTLPPATRTNAFRIGDADAPQLLVDPSPESKDELTRLLQTLASDPPELVFLTHHHPDHHQFANVLARRLGLPVCISADSHGRIRAKHGFDYFDGVEVRLVGESDVMTRWHGEDVRVYSVPGHDEGQLALAPESLRWFIVGDLIQGIGTVVISAPEGDMAKYFCTLERVIDLNPDVIIPSHGIPMRSVHRLSVTLQHRRERELRILELHQSGHRNQAILETVYEGVDERLLPYAMRNIESHLVKLREEGRVQ